MNTTLYAIELAAALVICMLLLALRMKRRGLKAIAAFAAIPLSLVLGYALAWGLYAVLQMNVRLSVFRYSFMGGTAGVLLGVALSAKLTGQNAGRTLDAFAPIFAALIALCRVAEMNMGDVGLGHYTETAWMCRFPFAMVNEWQEWYVAVFMLEAVAALLAALVLLLLDRRERAPGLLMERAVYLLCVPQIFCEQLRTMYMAWGFVRVEQVLCAVLVLVLMARSCYVWHKGSQTPVLAAWWPVLAVVVLAGVVTAMEFALDGKIQMPIPLVWGLFVLSLALMLVVQRVAVVRRIALETEYQM